MCSSDLVMQALASHGAAVEELPAPSASGPKSNVITCRLDDATLNALDILVEAGVRTTRSDAAAWLIGAGIEAHRPLIARVTTTVEEIRRLRDEARAIASETLPAPGDKAPEHPETEPPESTGDTASK